MSQIKLYKSSSISSVASGMSSIYVNNSGFLVVKDDTNTERTLDITDVVRDSDITDVVRDSDITDVVRDSDIGTMASRNVTISTDSPSGGNDGDIWYQVGS